MMEEYRSTEDIFMKRRMFNSRKRLYWSAIAAAVVGFVIGILIGRFGTCPDNTPPVQEGAFLPGVGQGIIEDGDPEIGDIIMNDINSDNIEENLRKLTEKPHLAGTEEEHELAKYLADLWTKQGLDKVTLTPYNVLLSYPNMSDLNYVELLDENGTSQYKSELREPTLTPEENKTGVVPPFNAYSAPGDIKGELVYVNYGRVEDYHTLENITSLNVSGKIVLCRYGKIFRGDQVRIAQRHGAIGVILFTDPADFAGGPGSRVYPDDWWMPPTGTQRGTLFIGEGDPQTPGYPSIDSAYRIPEAEILGNATQEQNREYPFYIPRIPCHPVGYGIAVKLMEQMSGETVPDEWQGGMNVTYTFGGSFKTPGWKAHIKISTHNQQATVYNVVGIIKGQFEPDRYVILGNHRDAWVFGAQDPSSGTAVMMEISRVMGQLVKTGKWRPRRSIIFCSWGAEEYGLIGSTEWVEHYTKSLGARAVAYLNVDMAIEGNASLTATGTPLILRPLYEAAKKVPNPRPDEVAAGRKTVFDTWMTLFPSETSGVPKVDLPGSGSDHAPFRDQLGVPIVDMWFTYDPNLNLSSYPLYHSVYETFYEVNKIMDRDFKVSKAMGQVWAEMARHIADSLIIPFNVSDYAVVMESMAKTLLTNSGKLLKDNGIETDLLTEAVSNFTGQVKEFEKMIQNVNKNDPYSIRLINDQLIQLNRAFLDPAGLPGRGLKRHILFADSLIDNYSGSSFPGITDNLFEIETASDREERWKIVSKHFSVIIFTIQSAASTLKDVTDFMYSY